MHLETSTSTGGMPRKSVVAAEQLPDRLHEFGCSPHTATVHLGLPQRGARRKIKPKTRSKPLVRSPRIARHDSRSRPASRAEPPLPLPPPARGRPLFYVRLTFSASDVTSHRSREREREGGEGEAVSRRSGAVAILFVRAGRTRGSVPRVCVSCKWWR